MFNNIGDKLMTAALWVAIVGCAGAVCLGICYCFSSALLGIIVLVIGCLSALLASMMLYGFGHLICNSDETLEILRGEDPSPTSTVEDRRSFAPVKVVPDEEGKIPCPLCGSVQRGDRGECWSCGQTFSGNKN